MTRNAILLSHCNDIVALGFVALTDLIRVALVRVQIYCCRLHRKLTL